MESPVRPLLLVAMLGISICEVQGVAHASVVSFGMDIHLRPAGTLCAQGSSKIHRRVWDTSASLRPARSKPLADRGYRRQDDCPAEGGQKRTSPGVIALRAALDMRGVPYSWGGGGPAGPSYGSGRGARTKGFDCSGLAEYAWARARYRIGSTTREQWRSGATIPRPKIKPGDLVFYDVNRSKPGPEHVGIAVNQTQIVNAPFTGSVVRIGPLNRPGYLGVVRPRPELRTRALP